MAIDFDMMSVVAYCLPDAKHNKKDFDRDFNRFIEKQDMLSIATNKAQAEGRLDEFLSYVDNQVAVDVVHGCDDKSRLSVAIENAYLAESVRAKLYGNESFGDVAHAVYEKFEGKIIPEEFVGSAQYVNNFIKGSFGENNLVYALSDKISEKEVADWYLLDTEGLSDWELDTYPIYDVVDAYRLGAYERFSSECEEHIDLISYANDLDTFESKFDCRKYAGDVVKSRLRSVLESSFEREFVQASSRVYFNKNLNGGKANVLDNKHLKLPKLGRVKTKRFDMPDVYKIFNVTVERTNTGKYYASICIETEVQPLPKTGKQVGFDLGLIDLLIGSDGTRYERPKFSYAFKDKIAKEQHKLSKMRTKLERE